MYVGSTSYLLVIFSHLMFNVRVARMLHGEGREEEQGAPTGVSDELSLPLPISVREENSLWDDNFRAGLVSEIRPLMSSSASLIPNLIHID